MLNIAVFFGGKSVEHDISIITAMQVIRSLKNYNVLPVYILPDGRFLTGNKLKKSQSFLNFKMNGCKFVTFDMGNQNLLVLSKNKIKNKIKIDCALLCNHGHGGEDGSLQGLLELANIPYSSSNVLSSALTMDKVLTKIMLKHAKINTPAYLHFDKCQYETNKIDILHKIKTKIKLPCIVKPASLGSSVGVNICEDEANIENLIDQAFAYDNKIIVEEFITNAREFCCAVLKIGQKLLTSRVTEIDKKVIYSFSDKYLTKKEPEKREISKSLNDKIKSYSTKTYSALLCDGIVRIDFLYNEKKNKLYVNELNSIPGSLSCNMFETNFDDLLSTLIKESIFKKESQNDIVYKFNSDAIKKFIDMESHFKYKR